MEKWIHYANSNFIKRVEGLYHIVPIKSFRKTKDVNFELMPLWIWCHWIDIVTHSKGAHSPWEINWVWNHWYKHLWQEDNLITLHWYRNVELFSIEHWKIEKFEVSHDRIKLNWEVVYEGAAMLWWPINVFHRNCSPVGSVSINWVIRFDNFDIDTEFNIYDLDLNTLESKTVRIWKLDQD